MKDIILFGIQGSGKGTQAKLLQEQFGYVSYSTGEALRDHMERKTDIGKRAAVYYDAGNLVPDDILVEMLQDLFASIDQTKAVIFDGVPRTEIQARGFDQVVKEYDRSFVTMLIELSEAEATNRILLRGEQTNRSDDQDIEVVRKRFQNFHEKTFPIIDHYAKSGTLLRINGNQSVEKVHEDIVEALKNGKAI